MKFLITLILDAFASAESGRLRRAKVQPVENGFSRNWIEVEAVHVDLSAMKNIVHVSGAHLCRCGNFSM